VQSESEIDRTLDLLAEADISIVTLPTVNMYLQDRRGGRTPRWRGVTVVHEMIERGIRVAAAGDNCRDSFYAYGDHDMVDTFRQAVRILHFDHPLSEAPSLVAGTPSRIAKLEGHGSIGEGAPARLIVFNARSLNEIVSRPQADRVVLEGGRRLAAKPPDYSELWADDDLPDRTAAAE
jgi:cytosine deaminase